MKKKKGEANEMKILEEMKGEKKENEMKEKLKRGEGVGGDVKPILSTR
jgi:hypothetical protein